MRGVLVGLFVVGLAAVAGCKKPNQAPDVPAVPSGPSSGAVGVEYTFSSSAADPDGDSVAIRFDWGDGDTSDWSRWVRPGDTATSSHSWSSIGTFSVRAQTKDTGRNTSAWSSGYSFAVIRTWTKTFGGVEWDEGYCVQQTQDGGFVITGTTGSYGAGNDDIWLIKTDASGDTAWTRTFGGSGDEVGNAVRQTQDGGFIVVGYTCPHGTSERDVWLVKTDASGNDVWDKTFGGVGLDEGSSVEQTPDGGYIIAGFTESSSPSGSDAWLIKTDADGDTVWSRAFGGERADWGTSVGRTMDGGYFVAGYTYSYGAGGGDMWLVKTDATGNRIWDRTFGGAGRDDGYSAQQTLDGGYVIAGNTESYGAGDADMWLVKTDAAGDTVWTRSFGGTSGDYGRSVQQTRDGGFIVVGITSSFGAAWDNVWLVRADAHGDTLWTRTYDGEDTDGGSSVRQTMDGGYIITGTTYSYGAGWADIWLIRTDAEGRVDEGLAK